LAFDAGPLHYAALVNPLPSTMNAPRLAGADQERLMRYMRLLLSARDFKHAFRCGEGLVSEHEAYAARRDGNDLVLRALYCSHVVAYSRPFNSTGRTRFGVVPPLGGEFRATLSEPEAELHDHILVCRNRLVAHSDAAAADPLPYVATDLPGQMVVPEMNDSLAPFTAEASIRARDLAQKARIWSIYERRDLEPQIVHLLERRRFLPGDEPHEVGGGE
jgi:hypothetical protein